jgi:hypothetical protein
MTEYKSEDYIKYRIELARDTIEEVNMKLAHTFFTHNNECMSNSICPYNKI